MTNCSPLVICRNITDDNIKVMTEFVSDKYSYIDKIDFTWKIMDDTMTILGYPCQKAVTNFRGRQYNAWFTNLIPLSTGPWKFYGLPGLILNIHDTDNYFTFQCSSIYISNGIKEPFSMNDPEYTTTTRERYNKQEGLAHLH